MTRVHVGRPPRRLEAVVATPAGGPRGAAVVCHPHPQMGGDMDNPVVLAVADVLVDAGLTVLRFNFGGVGRSEGGYSGGAAEIDDVRAALTAVEEYASPGLRVLAGYSFGAWAALRAVAAGATVDRVIAVAPPLAFLDWAFLSEVRTPAVLIAGDRDAYCPAARLAAVEGPSVGVHVVPGADHFFAGAEDALRHAVARAMASLAS